MGPPNLFGRSEVDACSRSVGSPSLMIGMAGEQEAMRLLEGRYRMTSDDQDRSASGVRNVIAMGFVSLFTDISSEMCFSILPTFVIRELGATTAILGLIEGSAEATSYISRMASGIASDRFRKRKPIVLVGYAFSTVVKPLFSRARVWADALTVRVADRVGKGVRTSPRDALLSESVPTKHMGKAFGVHRTLDQLGAILGPVFAAALIPIVGGRGVFGASFIPGLIALIILLFFVREAVRGPQMVKKTIRVREVLLGNFPWLLLVVAIFSLGAFNFSFVLLKAGEMGLPEALIPLVYAVINIAHTGAAIPAGILSDRIGGEFALLAAYAAFSATSLLCITLRWGNFYALLIAVAYGVYLGAARTVQRALVPQYSSADLRATAYGVYYLTIGVCLWRTP